MSRSNDRLCYSHNSKLISVTSKLVCKISLVCSIITVLSFTGIWTGYACGLLFQVNYVSFKIIVRNLFVCKHASVVAYWPINLRARGLLG